MEEIEEQPKKRKYTKHPKEYKVFHEGVSSIMIPIFESNLDAIKEIGNKILEDPNISKEDWTTLYNIVKDITDASKDMHHVIAYNNKYVEEAKYVSKHSTYYIATNISHIKYMLKFIDKALKLNKDDIGYEYNMYLAMEHLFYYIVGKEKI